MTMGTQFSTADRARAEIEQAGQRLAELDAEPIWAAMGAMVFGAALATLAAAEAVIDASVAIDAGGAEAGRHAAEPPPAVEPPADAPA